MLTFNYWEHLINRRGADRKSLLFNAASITDHAPTKLSIYKLITECK